MRVLFVCDAGPEVGGGHVMRCLTLAGALERRGLQPLFLATPAVADLLDRFAPETARLPAPADGLVATARQTPADLVVFDHYGLHANDHAAAVGDRPMLVMDDMADRELYADLVVNPGLVHRSDVYESLAPAARRVLLGPAYAMVRPHFTALRQTTLDRRAAGAAPSRLLISIGLGDLDGLTAWVLDTLLPLADGLAIDVVLGSGAPSLPKVRAMAERIATLSLHIDTLEMARLLAEADIAVGAGGSSAWERCVLGLPSVCLWLADNQRDNSFALESAGAAITVHGHDNQEEAEELREAFRRLLTDAVFRSGMARAAAKLCDGRGADRIAEAIVAFLA